MGRGTSVAGRVWRRARPATGLVLAGLVLAGCGSVRAGTAVRVGDQQLSVGEFQSQVQDLVAKSGRSDVSPAELGQAQRTLLRQYVDNQLILVVARRQGMTASQAEIGAVQAEIDSQRVLVPDGMRADFARWVVLERKLERRALGHTPKSQDEQQRAQRLVGDQLIRAARRVGVSVNPRYGEWSAGQVVADGALVTPTPPPATGG